MLVLHQRPHQLVIWQSDEADYGRRVEGGIGVEGIAAVGRNVVIVPTGLVGGRDLLSAGAVEFDTVEVFLRGVLGGGVVVNVAILLTDGSNIDHVHAGRGDRFDVFAIRGNDIQPLPAIALAQPDEFFAAFEPLELTMNIHPGLIFFHQNGTRSKIYFTRNGFVRMETLKHFVGVLQAIKLLQKDIL